MRLTGDGITQRKASVPPTAEIPMAVQIPILRDNFQPLSDIFDD
jgi:hypothetical protein